MIYVDVGIVGGFDDACGIHKVFWNAMKFGEVSCHFSASGGVEGEVGGAYRDSEFFEHLYNLNWGLVAE